MLSDERRKKLEKLLQTLNLESCDLKIVSRGLTHTSYIYENDLTLCDSYERLEFLGDAVLKLVVSNYLYTTFPDSDEGQLTKIRSIIVSDVCLAEFAAELDLMDYVLLGNVDFHAGKIPHSILACAFEGLLGALYLTSDLECVSNFIVEQIRDTVDDIANNRSYYNSKAILQEYTQGKNKDLPIYTVIDEVGPEHNKTFQVEVTYQDSVLAHGEGKTKKEAQQNAATAACIKLGILE